MMHLAQSQQRLLGLSQGVSEADLARMEPIMTDIFAAVTKSANADDARARVRARADTGRARHAEGHRVDGVRRSCSTLRTTGPATSCSTSRLPFLSRIRVPVLALNGALDRQVPADENLAAIKARARAQRGRHHPQDRRAQPPVSDGAHRRHRRVRGYRGDDRLRSCSVS